MKRLTTMLIGVVVLLATGQAPPAVISLRAPPVIRAGEAWALQVSVTGAAGKTVQAELFNGLQRFDSALALDEDGAATWQLPAGTITQAGESLVRVRYAGLEVRRRLTVLPDALAEADLFATANQIPAYGDGQTTLILLSRDQWGNPVHPPKAAARVIFPDGTRETLAFTAQGGLETALLHSVGGPGRVRISFSLDQVQKTLEVFQVPGDPSQITLTITPTCVLDDGRDTLSFSARVTDAQGSAVADGTLVQFVWEGGQGYGSTTGGTATLKLPAPTAPGLHLYQALSGSARSIPYAVQVKRQGCADEP